MENVKDIIDKIGAAHVMSAARVGYKSIHRAISDNQCPASWYAVIKDECDRAGIDCPLYLFAFKPPLHNTHAPRYRGLVKKG